MDVVEEAEKDLGVTRPHPEQEQEFSLQWVYNGLEHKEEAERIIYEDPDPVTGFILAPDFKWSGDLPRHIVRELYGAFRRYEDQGEGGQVAVHDHETEKTEHRLC